MEQHIQQKQSAEWGEATLPCPEPTPAAIEAGTFGFDEGGVIVPTAEDIRAMTEEHARELYCILLELNHLGLCTSQGVDPLSGRAPRGSERRHALLERLKRESQSLLGHYDDALAAYADGFGLEAAESLDCFVKAILAKIPPEPPPLLQREMF